MVDRYGPLLAAAAGYGVTWVLREVFHLNLLVEVLIVALALFTLVLLVMRLIRMIQLDLLLRRNPHLRYLLALHREFGGDR